MHPLRPFLVVLLSAALPACLGPSSLEEVPQGPWGGEHVALEVDASGADFELDCAHGRMEAPLRLDAMGRFAVEGYSVAEGPPVTEGSFERQPAAFTGSTDGQRLDFSLTLLDSGLSVGSFTVYLSEPARLLKCL